MNKYLVTVRTKKANPDLKEGQGERVKRLTITAESLEEANGWAKRKYRGREIAVEAK